MLQAMDAPTREECVAKRSKSNSPVAAMVLLNDPSFFEAAEEFVGMLEAVAEQYNVAPQAPTLFDPDTGELVALGETYEDFFARVSA